MAGSSSGGAFLSARLDEDEAIARRNIGAGPGEQNGLGDTDDGGPMWPDYQTFDGDDLDAAYDYLKRFRPLRALREVEAKRAILDLYERTLAIVRAPVDLQALAAEKPVIRELRARDYLDAERELCMLDPVVRYLTAIDSGHPDYDPSCKP